MSLYIRDDEVDALARKVLKATKAPNKTEAVRRALQNELARVEATIPFRQRIRKLQDEVREIIGPNKVEYDLKKFNDEMWEI
ncbi:histidinol dehydrogenase [Brucella endophytica]|uniref:Histidinol dehydrogenase n=1 Tax=Brucella endophytica TaxID=1963359 RepID=A0A916WLN5_9HYPH|nr:type II toxin-antitoxin system VapB family antitoxin [Brucella endophytica]GGB09499.1 histidinol dehydrogenase [Brucella endophytica]